MAQGQHTELFDSGLDDASVYLCLRLCPHSTNGRTVEKTEFRILGFHATYCSHVIKITFLFTDRVEWLKEPTSAINDAYTDRERGAELSAILSTVAVATNVTPHICDFCCCCCFFCFL